jgi:hypothetical protein
MSEELDLKGAEITLLDEEEELLDEDGDPIDEEVHEAVFSGGILLYHLYDLWHWANEGAVSDAHREYLKANFDDAVERLKRLQAAILIPWATEKRKQAMLEFVAEKIQEAPPDSKERKNLMVLLGLMKERL